MSGKAILICVSGKPGGYKHVDFVVNNKTYKNSFLVKAYSEYLSTNGTEATTIAFLPHNLWSEKETLEVFGIDKVIISPSMGKSEKYSYNATYDYIVLWHFLNILDVYLQSRAEGVEIYCDIALGWNVYSDALKEALKQLLVFDRLMYFQRSKLKGFRLFSDPIYGNKEEESFRVYSQEIKVRVWFDSPMDRFDKEYLQGLMLSDQEIELVKNFNHVYRAVKYNAPLILFTFGYDSADTVMKIIKNLLERFKAEFDPLKHVGSTTVEYTMPSNPRDLISLFQTLALYYNVAKVLEKAEVPKEGGEEVSLDRLRESALKIFESYGLYINCVFLNKEISTLKDKLSRKSVGPHYESLGFYLERANFKPSKSVSLRNFLAHAGLELNCTEVRRKGREILVRYSPGKRDSLKNLLQNKATCR